MADWLDYNCAFSSPAPKAEIHGIITYTITVYRVAAVASHSIPMTELSRTVIYLDWVWFRWICCTKLLQNKIITRKLIILFWRYEYRDEHLFDCIIIVDGSIFFFYM